ncbi:hypothetical protein [Nocardia vulneris]|uniref:Uncharacterized protein n=1 Tax=Nocardia vulneris TaxID=1141657 RepID=A0ABR4ZD20_9NOCA|nr:hypothetical protein [Nocardia vulneris]KIA63044.1 hypothetical protein FG87_22055 [Nocardia vulneris]
MSAVDPKAVFRSCLYIASLPVPSTAFEIGRALLLTPERRWAKFLRQMSVAFPAGTPEHETVVALQRIVVGDQEAAA